MSEQQCTADVLMIRPASFCANSETAETNRFQDLKAGDNAAQSKAIAEFDSLATALQTAGVTVHAFDDTPFPVTPDALFPNNWVSFHSDETTVLYPMLAPNRRQERRNDILSALQSRGFRTRRIVDLTTNELDGIFLEGTGSLVLDRTNRIAYAGISARTNVSALGEFSQQLDYDLITFETADSDGASIYHTNVLMSVGRNYAVVCGEVIAANQRHDVFDALKTTGHEVIEITRRQMSQFAGNILELATGKSTHIVAMSARAASALTTDQHEKLIQLAGPVVTAPIPTIETLGGGSVRCMLAEIHLPNTERT